MSEERIKSEEDLDSAPELTAEQLQEVAGGAKEGAKKSNGEEIEK